jgi:endonuclease V-like protein UPF0215 family
LKPGTRCLGIAESYRRERSTLAGAVARADRTVEDLVYRRCTVGGTDATEAVVDLIDEFDRPDVRYVMASGIAPAWFNLLDLQWIAEAADRPALSVSFEESSGLDEALRREFDGDALEERLGTYERQPARSRFTVNGEPVWVRSVGLEDDAARDVVRGFTPEGGRPEPVRVARIAARAADGFLTDS